MPDFIQAVMERYLIWVKIALLALFGAALFASGWKISSWRHASEAAAQVKDLQDQINADRDRHVQEVAKWEAASLVDAAKLDSLETQKDVLLATLSGLKLTRTVTVKADAQGNCVADVLAPDFRLRWNGVVSTTAAPPAAGGGD